MSRVLMILLLSTLLSSQSVLAAPEQLDCITEDGREISVVDDASADPGFYDPRVYSTSTGKSLAGRANRTSRGKLVITVSLGLGFEEDIFDQYPNSMILTLGNTTPGEPLNSVVIRNQVQILKCGNWQQPTLPYYN